MASACWTSAGVQLAWRHARTFPWYVVLEQTHEASVLERGSNKLSDIVKVRRGKTH